MPQQVKVKHLYSALSEIRGWTENVMTVLGSLDPEMVDIGLASGHNRSGHADTGCRNNGEHHQQTQVQTTFSLLLHNPLLKEWSVPTSV